ncbi:MAG: DNA-directed RNA polymerase subunit N [Candidatus Diapherotrites archaeon]|nr:DNA-directed RNA polymerase subunit N [Candidatus Diapherotrites archaeon]
MHIPVRCFTCGKVIGQYWEEFDKRVKKGEDASKVLDDLGLERFCCRRMILSHEEVADDVKKYPR